MNVFLAMVYNYTPLFEVLDNQCYHRPPGFIGFPPLLTLARNPSRRNEQNFLVETSKTIFSFDQSVPGRGH